MIRELKSLNPVQDTTLAAPDRARFEADLERILANPRPTTRRSRTTPRVLVAAGAAVALGLLAVIGIPLLPGSSPSRAMAATPRVLDGSLATGSSDLTSLSSVARSTASSSGAASLGSSYETWSLFTRFAGGEPVRSAVVPQEVRLTLNPDHSGRLVVTIGNPVGVSGPVPDDLNLPAPGTVIRDESYGPGQAPLMFKNPLSANPATLWTQLTAGHAVDQLGSGELFVAMADLYRDQTPGPAVRAAIIGLLGTRSDIRDLGVIKDRAGRPGHGLGVSASQPGGLPSRFVIILDQTTGRLLSYEQILTKTPGKLDVEIPAVIDYTLFT